MFLLEANQSPQKSPKPQSNLTKPRLGGRYACRTSDFNTPEHLISSLPSTAYSSVPERERERGFISGCFILIHLKTTHAFFTGELIGSKQPSESRWNGRQFHWKCKTPCWETLKKECKTISDMNSHLAGVWYGSNASVLLQLIRDASSSALRFLSHTPDSSVSRCDIDLRDAQQLHRMRLITAKLLARRFTRTLKHNQQNLDVLQCGDHMFTVAVSARLIPGTLAMFPTPVFKQKKRILHKTNLIRRHANKLQWTHIYWKTSLRRNKKLNVIG